MAASYLACPASLRDGIEGAEAGARLLGCPGKVRGLTYG